MRSEYEEGGWRYGDEFDVKLTKWNGKGFDPSLLVGRKVKRYQQFGSEYSDGPLSKGILTIDHNGGLAKVHVWATPTSGPHRWREAKLDIDCGEIDFPRISIEGDRNDTEQWNRNSRDPPALSIASVPKVVVEVACGIRRDLCGTEIGNAIGLRLESMPNMGFFSAAISEHTPHDITGTIIVCLVDVHNGLANGSPVSKHVGKAKAVVQTYPTPPNSSQFPKPSGSTRSERSLDNGLVQIKDVTGESDHGPISSARRGGSNGEGDDEPISLSLRDRDQRRQQYQKEESSSRSNDDTRQHGDFNRESDSEPTSSFGRNRYREQERPQRSESSSKVDDELGVFPPSENYVLNDGDYDASEAAASKTKRSVTAKVSQKKPSKKRASREDISSWPIPKNEPPTGPRELKYRTKRPALNSPFHEETFDFDQDGSHV